MVEWSGNFLRVRERLTGGWSHVWGRRGLAEIDRDAGHYTFTYLMTSVVF